MPRPKQCRSVECPPSAKGFKPFGHGCIKDKGCVTLQIDEYEAMRLIDKEGLSQEAAALKMQVSRPTFTRIYDRARKTIAEAIFENKTLRIGEGDVEFYGGWHSNINKNINEGSMKKIAIPTTNGNLFPHFGKASQFTFVSIEDKKSSKRRNGRRTASCAWRCPTLCDRPSGNRGDCRRHWRYARKYVDRSRCRSTHRGTGLTH